MVDRGETLLAIRGQRGLNTSAVIRIQITLDFFDEMHHKSFFLESDTADSFVQTFSVRVVLVDQNLI